MAANIILLFSIFVIISLEQLQLLAQPINSDIAPISAETIDGRRNSCNLVFNIGRTAESQTIPLDIQTQLLESLTKAQMQKKDCNLLFVVKPTISTNEQSTNPFTDSIQAEETVETDDTEYSSQPVYEMQLAVWPTGIDDVAEVLETEGVEAQQIPVVPTTDDATTQFIPLYENQIVVFPDLTDGQDQQQVTGVNGVDGVIEKYHISHPNGTTEYKLVLSNGLVNYKKIYKKLVDNKEVTVQEGWDSIPIAGQTDGFYTQYYIADERGNNVYKVVYNYGNPH